MQKQLTHKVIDIAFFEGGCCSIYIDQTKGFPRIPGLTSRWRGAGGTNYH